MNKTLFSRWWVVLGVAAMVGGTLGASVAILGNSSSTANATAELDSPKSDPAAEAIAKGIEDNRSKGFDLVPVSEGVLGRVLLAEVGTGPAKTNPVKAVDTDDIIAYEVPGVGFVLPEQFANLLKAVTISDAANLVPGVDYASARKAREAEAERHLAEAKAQGRPIDWCRVGDDLSIECGR